MCDYDKYLLAICNYEYFCAYLSLNSFDWHCFYTHFAREEEFKFIKLKKKRGGRLIYSLINTFWSLIRTFLSSKFENYEKKV